MFERAPKLGSWIVGKPERAKVAHDDLANLGDMEQTIGEFRGPAPSLSSVAEGIFKSFGQGLDIAREGIRMQAADMFGFKAMGEDALRKFAQSKFESDIATPAFEGSTAKGLYGGAVSTIRAAPGIVGSILMRNPEPCTVDGRRTNRGRGIR